MNKGLPTFVRRDAYTGPSVLARQKKAPFYYKFIFDRISENIGGSREHFYHFLIGYLLPLVHAQSKYRFKRFLSLDCGPLMSPILHDTLTRLGYDFRIVQPSEIEKPIFLDSWDHGWRGRREKASVRKAQTLIRQAWGDYECPSNHCARSENLLIQRSNPHEFYLNGGSEVAGYGTSRRGVSNLQEVSEFLTYNGVDHSIYEPGAHCLGCQIEAFSASKRVLGFRGAEWANLIWSPPEVRVRMLDANPPAKLIGDFMDGLNIKHEFAIVDTPHSPENPQEALRFFSEK
jgi:hypothetical protein